MRVNMSKRVNMFGRMSLYTIYIIMVVAIILGGYRVESYKVYNSSGSKYLTSHHLSKTNVAVKEEVIPTLASVMNVTTMAEVVLNAPKGSVSFMGKMTGYGPDCVGCSGFVGCSPRRDVRNGNIYYEHQTYGKMRIVASDRRVPCGTIVEVSGAKGSQPFFAIVLDRGGVIKETLFDLLFNSEAEAKYFGRQTINYKTIRWGW